MNWDTRDRKTRDQSDHHLTSTDMDRTENRTSCQDVQPHTSGDVVGTETHTSVQSQETSLRDSENHFVETGTSTLVGEQNTIKYIRNKIINNYITHNYVIDNFIKNNNTANNYITNYYITYYNYHHRSSCQTHTSQPKADISSHHVPSDCQECLNYHRNDHQPLLENHRSQRESRPLRIPYPATQHRSNPQQTQKRRKTSISDTDARDNTHSDETLKTYRGLQEPSTSPSDQSTGEKRQKLAVKSKDRPDQRPSDNTHSDKTLKTDSGLQEPSTSPSDPSTRQQRQKLAVKSKDRPDQRPSDNTHSDKTLKTDRGLQEQSKRPSDPSTRQQRQKLAVKSKDRPDQRPSDNTHSDETLKTDRGLQESSTSPSDSSTGEQRQKLAVKSKDRPDQRPSDNTYNDKTLKTDRGLQKPLTTASDPSTRQQRQKLAVKSKERPDQSPSVSESSETRQASCEARIKSACPMDSKGHALEPGDAVWIGSGTTQHLAVYVDNRQVIRYDRTKKMVLKKELDETGLFYKCTIKREGECQVYPPEVRMKRAKDKIGQDYTEGDEGFVDDFPNWVYTGFGWKQSLNRGFGLH